MGHEGRARDDGFVFVVEGRERLVVRAHPLQKAQRMGHPQVHLGVSWRLARCGNRADVERSMLRHYEERARRWGKWKRPGVGVHRAVSALGELLFFLF